MGTVQIGFEESRRLLEGHGIPILGRVVSTREEAVAAADELGYPLVIKAVTGKIIHKSDVGVVLLNLEDQGALTEAWDLLIENARRAGAEELDGVLVQRMVEPGFELLIGAKQDPCFGPVTMIGHGGRFVELFKDVAPGVGVLTRADVSRMLSRTLAGQVLDGFRGPPLDREAVIGLAVSVSRFMDERPEVHELDLNPVIVYEEGFAVVDARVIRGDPVATPRMTDLSPARMESLKAIFNPKSVTVFGASRTGTVGGIILKNSSRIENVYPINPRHEKLLGGKIKTYSAEEEEKVARSVSANPVDLFGDCDDERLLESLRILNEDPETDMIVAALYFQVPYLSEFLTERLADLRREFTKPVIVSPRGYSKHVWRCRVDLGRRGYPSYTVPMMKPLAIAQEIWARYGKGFLGDSPSG